MSLTNIEKTIELDVYDHDTTPSVIKTIQMDTGTRTVFAVIQNSRQDYDIGQNATVSLTVLRPDKTKVQVTGQTFVCYTGTDGTMYGAKAELSDVALAVKGNLKAQFKITSGEQELRTEIFTISNGEALDADDGDWAGDLDGHNLDEMAQSIEDLSSDVAEIQEDVGDLKNTIDKTAIDYFALEIFSGITTGTHKGVAFTKGNNVVTANGTATGGSAQRVYWAKANPLPSGLVPGETVSFYVNTSNTNLRLVVIFYDSNDTQIGNANYFVGDKDITIPYNAAHALIYLDVPSGSQVSNASISISMYRSIFEIDVYKGLANFSLSFPGLSNYSKATQTNYGITFSWDSDRQAYHGAGTSTASMLFGFMTSRYKLPLGINAGNKFILSFASSDSHIYLKIRYFTSVEADTYTDANYTVTTANKIVEVPSNCVGINMYLGVYNGFTVDGYVALPILIPYAMRRFAVPEVVSAPKYISFIDDDTSTDTYVTRYYQACMHNGIRGNYAVVTGDYVNQINDISILKNAEADGFNLALHCDSQQTYLRPNSASFNEHNARLNYIRAINAFRSLGIINSQNMWIIPYGSRDEKTHQLASDLGFDIAFTTDGDTYNHFSDTDIYALHRTGLSSSGDVTDDTNPAELGTMARCKARINELVNSVDGGWLIITTHFNEWDDMTWDSTLDSNGYQIGYSRFNELVQYALNAGLTPISLAEGSVKWKEYIHRNKAILS